MLREKRLSNAQDRGICEADACYAPREVNFRGRDGGGISSIDQIGAVAQPFLVGGKVPQKI